MQSHASEKSAAAKPGPGASSTPAPQPAVAEGALPSQLDLAIGNVLEGMSQRTLHDVCMDLFARLENSLVTNRLEFINSYFSTLVKQDEMTLLWTDPAYYEHLRLIVQNEVMPLYDRYRAIREQVMARSQQRSWPKYCLWMIGICLGLELIFTEGRVLRPTMLLPAVAVDGFLGYIFYYLVNFRDISALKRANESLLNSIRDIDNKYDVAKRYEVFRSFSGGDLLAAELQLLLSSYGSPGEFWSDYYAVRKADPTTPAELEKLNRKRFNAFLQSHMGGSYSPEARQQRFNSLFLLANKTFILNDPHHYVLNHLQTQIA